MGIHDWYDRQKKIMKQIERKKLREAKRRRKSVLLLLAPPHWAAPKPSVNLYKRHYKYAELSTTPDKSKKFKTVTEARKFRTKWAKQLRNKGYKVTMGTIK